MKKASGLVGAALLFAGPALAADMATKPQYTPPPMAPVFSWTGCYVGADVGGAWPRQGVSITPSAATLQGAVAGDLGNNGSVIGGPYAGCNYQFIPAWVVGFEGDFSWTQLNGTASGPNIDLANNPPVIASGGPLWSRSTEWVASMRGRLGWVVVPNTLFYGTGGVAWTRSNYAGLDVFDNGSSLVTSFTGTQTGWVAGGGVDWAPWSNGWVFRFEYLHYQFSGISSVAASDATHFVNFNFGDLQIDTIRAGLSYKF